MWQDDMATAQMQPKSYTSINIACIYCNPIWWLSHQFWEATWPTCGPKRADPDCWNQDVTVGLGSNGLGDQLALDSFALPPITHWCTFVVTPSNKINLLADTAPNWTKSDPAPELKLFLVSALVARQLIICTDREMRKSWVANWSGHPIWVR